MNDRNKHKVTGQLNRQTADPKANASVFLFFTNAHLKQFLPTAQMAHLVFADTQSQRFKKPKEPFFLQTHQ